MARPTSLSNRYVQHNLGGAGCVRVPTDIPTATNIAESQKAQAQGDNHSTVPAVHAVVPTTAGLTDRPPPETAVNEGPAEAIPQLQGAPETRTTPVTRMEIVNEARRHQGFPEQVGRRVASTAIRTSTLKIDDSKWAKFQTWCRNAGRKPLEAMESDIAEFLMHLFQEELAVPTIKVYQTVVLQTILHTSGRRVNTTSTLPLLIRSFKLERPRSHKPFPQWDLSWVLGSRILHPYEPRQTADGCLTKPSS